MSRSFDLILVGTGFASSFFLKKYLEHSKPSSRVLVLERGSFRDHAWQLLNRRQFLLDGRNSFINGTPNKEWNCTPHFGGGSNCWWGCVPRFLPNDFKMRSLYGVGRDWPLSYDDLEVFYTEAEEIMQASGEALPELLPRSREFPQPPHRGNAVDALLRQGFPGLHVAQPTARARIAAKGRAVCCAAGVCGLCPSNAKFTIENGLKHLYGDPRVTLEMEAAVNLVEVSGNSARAVQYSQNGIDQKAEGQIIVLGANALFNPAILIASGLTEPAVGQGLHEQCSVTALVDLEGIDNFQGSTSITGNGYMFYDGPHRQKHAACLVEVFNIPRIRTEQGKWRQRAEIKFIFEDLPQSGSTVQYHSERRKPVTNYQGPSEYTQRGLKKVPEYLQALGAHVPIERVVSVSKVPTEGHIIGTTPMGTDPQSAVVDAGLKHHRVRNLLVLGSGVFPTSSPSNPTLTLSALALRAAAQLFRSAA